MQSKFLLEKLTKRVKSLTAFEYLFLQDVTKNDGVFIALTSKQFYQWYLKAIGSKDAYERVVYIFYEFYVYASSLSDYEKSALFDATDSDYVVFTSLSMFQLWKWSIRIKRGLKINSAQLSLESSTL